MQGRCTMGHGRGAGRNGTMGKGGGQNGVCRTFRHYYTMFATNVKPCNIRKSLLQQTGDTAMLRLQYVLAGRAVDARLPAVRIDGRWYLADYVRRAEQSLQAGAR